MGHAADDAEVAAALLAEAAAAAPPGTDLASPLAAAVLTHVASVGESLITSKSHSNRWARWCGVGVGVCGVGCCACGALRCVVTAVAVLLFAAACCCCRPVVFLSSATPAQRPHRMRRPPVPPRGIACLCRRSWENNMVPYLALAFGGDKGPATVTAHAMHHWALRHMGEPPVVGAGQLPGSCRAATGLRPISIWPAMQRPLAQPARLRARPPRCCACLPRPPPPSRAARRPDPFPSISCLASLFPCRACPVPHRRTTTMRGRRSSATASSLWDTAAASCSTTPACASSAADATGCAGCARARGPALPAYPAPACLPWPRCEPARRRSVRPAPAWRAAAPAVTALRTCRARCASHLLLHPPPAPRLPPQANGAGKSTLMRAIRSASW